MFGSNDKNQPDNTQQTDNGLVSAPADPVIPPTAPPLNENLVPSTDEPVLPPPQPTPQIMPDPSRSKASDNPAPPPSEPASHDQDELISIKQQALTSLAPMVHQLDQTPEEKFKTTMMLIQASDNAALIKDAYEAANAITDEKARAQALLDVVNEINYFTHHQESNNQAS